LIGDRLGRFTLDEKIGEGGMGVIYRARDDRLGRTVAIKLLRSDLVADRERTARFLQEARAASALNHPNIVTIYDIDDDPTRGTWIAMEHLEGESLEVRLARGRLDPSEAGRIALEVARGLASAHEAGIVHRDVKPANVMLTRSGQVKVLDFGIAKLVSKGTPDPTATQTGTIVGTPTYMSPEQIEGHPVDARSDVFSFGAMLYEMLAGRRPFSQLSATLKAPPAPLSSVRPGIDPRLEAIVSRCLSKDPARRYPSAGELAQDLQAATAPASRPRWAWVAALGVALLGFAVVAAWFWRGSVLEQRARRETLPEIQRRVESDDVLGAFRLAQEAREQLAGDPIFEKLWLDIISATSLRSEPPAADVLAKPYAQPGEPWWRLGKTPVQRELPRVFTRFRFEKDGYAPVEVAFSPLSLRPIQLFRTAETPEGMVRVPGGPFRFRAGPEVVLEDFWLDRFEVTNRQYQQFVNAGGYARPELWQHAFVGRGRTLSFAQAMASFRDGTGQPGPSTWQLGTFPEGQEDLPVSGVSWYEAAAYAAFAGRSLPTLHHWYRAADLSRFSDVLRYSNFGDKGPRKVGAEPSLAAFGNYDMAGNVREWVWNADGPRRYTLGGAWSDPTYLYTGPDALDPMDRSPILGFRCARYDAPPGSAALQDVHRVVRDASTVRPADDATFRIYRSFFDYDPGPLQTKVEQVDDRPKYWHAEKVSFAAAYGGERIPAWLYLPKNASPPYQTAIYFPPSSALRLPSIDQVGIRDFSYLVRSGRAVLFPAYQQTYERRRERPSGPNTEREVITERTLDVRRSIDFLESRPEIDRARIAFVGLSMGADEGTIVGAVEPRLRTLVLVAAGLQEDVPSEVDAIHFAPRVRVPVLMVNGRYDFLSPLEASQQPLFRLLGSPSGDKRHVLFESGHVPPWPDVVRETLNWLDRYLGPVQIRTSEGH